MPWETVLHPWNRIKRIGCSCFTPLWVVSANKGVVPVKGDDLTRKDRKFHKYRIPNPIEFGNKDCFVGIEHIHHLDLDVLFIDHVEWQVHVGNGAVDPYHPQPGSHGKIFMIIKAAGNE